MSENTNTIGLNVEIRAEQNMIYPGRFQPYSRPHPSVGDEYASDWWSDLTGGFSYYGSGGYDPSGEGGSRLAGAPCSDDEDDGRDRDEDGDE